VERLDVVYEHLGETTQRKKCKAMEGLLEEGKELLESNSDPEVLDAGLIAAAQASRDSDSLRSSRLLGFSC
jgi:ferritin-like metal-binding protein YciE